LIEEVVQGKSDLNPAELHDLDPAQNNPYLAQKVHEFFEEKV